MARRRTRKSATPIVQPALTPELEETVSNTATLMMEEPLVVHLPEGTNLTKAPKEEPKTNKVKLNHRSAAVINENSTKPEIITGAKEYSSYCEKMVNRYKDQRDLAFIAALASLLIGSVL